MTFFDNVSMGDDNELMREYINLPCDPGRHLNLVEPYRERLVVSCEGQEGHCFSVEYNGKAVAQ